MKKIKEWFCKNFYAIDRFIDYVFKVYVFTALIYFLMIVK